MRDTEAGTILGTRSTTERVGTSTIGEKPGSRRRSQAVDVLLVVLAWLTIVASAAVPIDNLGLRRAALFVHLMCLPVGFGAAVMLSLYSLLWLAGRRSLRDVVALSGVAHRAMAVGLGGLIASGIALDPDLQARRFQVKLVLLLVVMLTAVNMQQLSGRLQALPSGVLGPNVPWSLFLRITGVVVVSQVAWWGAIVIGFVTSTSR